MAKKLKAKRYIFISFIYNDISLCKSYFHFNYDLDPNDQKNFQKEIIIILKHDRHRTIWLE